MPRYSSVQTFADNNSRAISYEQAAGLSSAAAPTALRTEKIVNPYGSVAGSNSGDFHVYRHARAREMERVNALELSKEAAEKDQQFHQTMQEYDREAEERTAKRRKKRQRAKEAKKRKKNLKAAGVDASSVGANKVVVDESEFFYLPEHERTRKEGDGDLKDAVGIERGHHATKVDADESSGAEEEDPQPKQAKSSS